MAPANIKCENCGRLQWTKRPDLRKFCDTCRTLRDLRALRRRVHTCMMCKRRFYAHDNDSARALGKVCCICLETPVGEERPGEACSIGSPVCDSTRLAPGLTMCWPCATQADDIPKALTAQKAILAKYAALGKGA